MSHAWENRVFATRIVQSLFLLNQIFKLRHFFCGCTARFVSDLAGKPEDRFSNVGLISYRNCSQVYEKGRWAIVDRYTIRAVLTCTHNLCFEFKKKKDKKKNPKIWTENYHFYAAVNYCSILHWLVCVIKKHPTKIHSTLCKHLHQTSF